VWVAKLAEDIRESIESSISSQRTSFRAESGIRYTVADPNSNSTERNRHVTLDEDVVVARSRMGTAVLYDNQS